MVNVIADLQQQFLDVLTQDAINVVHVHIKGIIIFLLIFA